MKRFFRYFLILMLSPILYAQNMSIPSVFNAPTSGTVSSVSSSQAEVPLTGGSRYYVEQESGGSTIDSINGYKPLYFPYGAACFRINTQNVTSNPETAGPDLSVRASLEYPIDSGLFIPFYFNGSRTLNLSAKGSAQSDPMCIGIPVGGLAYVRYFVQRATGQSTVIPANWHYGTMSGTKPFYPRTTTTVGNRFDGLEELTTRTITDAVCNGTTTLSSATANFKAQEIGETITLPCGASGASLTTTYTYASATTATLGTAASISATVTANLIPTDKSMGGVIYNAQGTSAIGWSPHSVIGTPAVAGKTLSCFGDSRSTAAGSYLFGTWCAIAVSLQNMASNLSALTFGYATNSFVSSPYINEGMSGETYQNFSNPSYRANRMRWIGTSKYIFAQLGINDTAASESLSTIQGYAIPIWKALSSSGPKVFFSTLEPRTSSTDGWLSTANQTPIVGESVRVAYNTWMRDGAPIDVSNMSAVAAGTTGSSIARTAYYGLTGTTCPGQVLTNAANGSCVTSLKTPASGPSGHPLYGVFEFADAVESSRNSGAWMADPGAVLVTGCNIPSGTNPVATCPSIPITAGSDLISVYNGSTTASPVVAGGVLGTYGTSTTVIVAGTYGSACNNCAILFDGYGNTNNNTEVNGRLTTDGIHGYIKAQAVMGKVAGSLLGLLP